MSDYRVTIHMKIGPPRYGIRWHPSYDTDHVKKLVPAKRGGTAAVKWVALEIIARSTGDRMESKNLKIGLVYCSCNPGMSMPGFCALE